jgi:hypothetical protein
MADNRMFLFHKESMMGAALGKRYRGAGWYHNTPEKIGQNIQALFDEVEKNYPESMDEFSIITETDEINYVYDMKNDDFEKFTEKGIILFIIREREIPDE